MNEVSQFLVNHAASTLFLAIFAEQIGMLFPAAPVLLAAGALTADGVLNPGMALGVTVAGCVLADLVWFYIGRHGGEKALHFLTRFFLSDSSRFEQTERLFAKYGMPAVAAGKFVPGLSLIMPPLAGAFRVGVGRFLLYDGLGSLVYAFFYLGLGFVFKSEVNSALEFLGDIGFGTIALGVGLILIFFGYKHVRCRRGGLPAGEHRPGRLAAAPATTTN